MTSYIEALEEILPIGGGARRYDDGAREAQAKGAAPFRELFVELPRVVCETLQCIGEAAVDVAAERTRQRSVTVMAALETCAARQMLCQRYGWKSCETSRSSNTEETWLVVVHGCGHRQGIEIDEHQLSMARGQRAAVEVLLDIIERTERRCCCVPLSRQASGQW